MTNKIPDRDRPAALSEFGASLTMFLGILHDRGVANETAVLEVCRQLVQHQPLTVDHLAAIFGAEPIYTLMTSPARAWDRARLCAQFDALREDLAGIPFDGPELTPLQDLVRVNLQIVALLRDECCQRPLWGSTLPREDEPATVQLVREAYKLLHNPDTTIDLRDWLRAAEPYVRKVDK